MIQDAVVVCLPGEAHEELDRHALAHVAGLPVVTRIVVTLLRAGMQQVLVLAAAADAPGVREVLGAHKAVREAGGRVQVLEKGGEDIAGWLEPLARHLPGPYLLWRSDRIHELGFVKQIAAEPATGAVDLSAHPGLPIRTPLERRAAEKRLLAGLVKSVDGPVSRYLNRPMSLAVTRRLLDTNVTPNHMTVVANVIGAIGVWFVFQATWTSVAIGALLVHTQSVLDGCDGEIARLKYLSSRFGEWFDNVTDNCVNAAYGMGLGFATAELYGWPVFRWIGVGSAAGFLLYDLTVYSQLALVHRTGNPFAFRWWFQKQDADLTATFAAGGTGARVAAFFRALGRRDVFLFCFMLLCFARLTFVASVWYALLAAGHLVMTLLHGLNGGMPRALRR